MECVVDIVVEYESKHEVEYESRQRGLLHEGSSLERTIEVSRASL